MSAIIPSVKVSTRPTLQQTYFTSELFVNAARSDIDNLLSTFDLHVEGESQPYAEFKRVWVKEGWNLAYLYIMEDTARDEYFRTMFRLFLERLNEDEEEVLQIGALFGLYTLYETQVNVPSLHRLKHILIPIDILQHLHALSESCENPEFALYVLYILQHFLCNDIFHIIPESTLRPYAPTVLPHSRIVRKDEEGEEEEQQSAMEKEGEDSKAFNVATTTTTAAHSSRGGITKTDRDRTGRAKWALLTDWVDERAPRLVMKDVQSSILHGGSGGVGRSGETYETTRQHLLEVLPKDIEDVAEKRALGRLKALLPRSSRSHPTTALTADAQDHPMHTEGDDEEEEERGEESSIVVDPPPSSSRTGKDVSEGIEIFERTMLQYGGGGILRNRWNGGATNN